MCRVKQESLSCVNFMVILFYTPNVLTSIIFNSEAVIFWFPHTVKPKSVFYSYKSYLIHWKLLKLIL